MDADFSTGHRVAWGAVGGCLPFALQLIRQGSASLSQPFPNIGGFYILALLLSILVGVVASFAFKSHNILAALYHGATAPITLAFLIGTGSH